MYLFSSNKKVQQTNPNQNIPFVIHTCMHPCTQNISKRCDLYQPGGEYTEQSHLEAFPRQHLNPQLHSHGCGCKHHPLAWCFESLGER